MVGFLPLNYSLAPFRRTIRIYNKSVHVQGNQTRRKNASQTNYPQNE